MTRRRSQRRGVSLMMVLSVVGVAAVMGTALMSGQAIQAAASANQDRVVQADALAESGVNLGLYYLQNLTDSNKTLSGLSTLAPGATVERSKVTLGAGRPGEFDVAITRLAPKDAHRYQIRATGRTPLGSAAGQSPAFVQRTLTVQADVNYFGYGLMATNVGSGTLTIPSTTKITGDVCSSVPVQNLGKVNGTIYAGTASGGGGGGGGGGLLGGVIDLVVGLVGTLLPDRASANHYSNQYVYNGFQYNAQPISSPVPENKTYGPSTSNPAGVFYCDGNLTLSGGVRIDGTLVVRRTQLLILVDPGALQVKGKNNTIRAALPNFPAIVADGGVSFSGTDPQLDVRGLAYLGDAVTHSGTVSNARLDVTGALLFGGTDAAVLDPAVATDIDYDRFKASVPSLVTTGQVAPTSVSVVNWKN